MAEGGDDKDQKTEEPTQKKLDDALKKGDVAKSQDLVAWFILFAAAVTLANAGAWSAGQLQGPLAGMLANADQLRTDGASLTGLAVTLGLLCLAALGVPLLMFFLAGVAGNLVQHRLVFSAESLKPKFSKVSPIAGFKRLFGKEAIVNFVKGLLKIGLLGTVMVVVLWPQRGLIDTMIRMDVQALLPKSLDLLMAILIPVVAILAIFAALDYFYQYQTWRGRQRMSFQEIKEEYKQQEGNPEVKGKLRKLRRERAQKRMMQAVPSATVVVTNPTHFAVALKYEKGMVAPICVAKGADLIARTIRETALKHDVPIVENPPLARALFAAIDIDDPVPEEHYRAAAEVIGYVLRLKGAIP